MIGDIIYIYDWNIMGILWVIIQMMIENQRVIIDSLSWLTRGYYRV
jgi:hypothetical protein